MTINLLSCIPRTGAVFVRV